MAKSTFSGPVRSEDTFKTVSKAASTGTITEVITLGFHWWYRSYTIRCRQFNSLF